MYSVNLCNIHETISDVLQFYLIMLMDQGKIVRLLKLRV